jgi:hypothetical protein
LVAYSKQPEKTEWFFAYKELCFVIRITSKYMVISIFLENLNKKQVVVFLVKEQRKTLQYKINVIFPF